MSWHLNKNHEPKKCRAKKIEACPFFESAGNHNHYDTGAEAVEASEKIIAKIEEDTLRKSEARCKRLMSGDLSEIPEQIRQAEKIDPSTISDSRVRKIMSSRYATEKIPLVYDAKYKLLRRARKGKKPVMELTQMELDSIDQRNFMRARGSGERCQIVVHPSLRTTIVSPGDLKAIATVASGDGSAVRYDPAVDKPINTRLDGSLEPPSGEGIGPEQTKFWNDVRDGRVPESADAVKNILRTSRMYGMSLQDDLGMYATPSKDNAELVKQALGPGDHVVIDPLAGRGYMANALRSVGVKTIASDNASWNDADTDTGVEKADAVHSLDEHKNGYTDVLISWAPSGIHSKEDGKGVDEKILRKVEEDHPEAGIVVIGERHEANSMGGFEYPINTGGFWREVKRNKNATVVNMPGYKCAHGESALLMIRLHDVDKIAAAIDGWAAEDKR